ncbi:MAG: nitroreductase family protein [Longicatena sp.]
MNKKYFDQLVKRKSFHTRSSKECLSEHEIEQIQNQFHNLLALDKKYKTHFALVPSKLVSSRVGEYCILMYSSKEENDLVNIGYMGEQLDLWLADHNIGACWFGMGKAKEQCLDGLDFVIMMAIQKVDKQSFRSDVSKVKRKKLEAIWNNAHFKEIGEIVRYAPSACNSQPWLIEGDENSFCLYRVPGKLSFMTKKDATFYNKIDCGIMMCFLDVCLEHFKYSFAHTLAISEDSKKQKIATYKIG